VWLPFEAFLRIPEKLRDLPESPKQSVTPARIQEWSSASDGTGRVDYSLPILMKHEKY
jgi:hypothetical protein